MDVKASFMTYLDQLKRSNSDPSLGKEHSGSMACEGCAQKFTVFKRKKLCNICLRHFCNHCLSPQLGPNAANSVLARLTDRRHICATCLVLTARPLCRLQLRRLKVKDLQHYLMAHRISTRGCVEKDDLVNLLIRHVGSTNNGSYHDNICNSHPDLSGIQDTNLPNSSFNRPPQPPRDLPRTTASSTNHSASSSPSHQVPPHSIFVSATMGTTTTTTTTPTANASASVSSSASSSTNLWNSGQPCTSLMETSPLVEIVELNEDWSGDPDDLGPEPMVEEISESVGGTLSSPTSAGDQNTLSSSTTSLGEPNVTSSSSSSPSHEHPPPAEEVATTSSATANTELPETVSSCEPMPDSPDLGSVRPAVITLNTIKTLEELQKMSVKQIKDLLMRNRVDFRGCCERTELVERATRLWVENQESRKALDQIGTAEMCKICMDAPIECVMLECGHMATCMSCGKQLSECPLCRQYVVRVVRTFRA